jgi:hypothetical protein
MESPSGSTLSDSLRLIILGVRLNGAVLVALLGFIEVVFGNGSPSFIGS